MDMMVQIIWSRGFKIALDMDPKTLLIENHKQNLRARLHLNVIIRAKVVLRINGYVQLFRIRDLVNVRIKELSLRLELHESRVQS